MNKDKENLNFFNKWAKTYDLGIFQFWMRGFQKPALKIIDTTNKPKILDISCGTGELLLKLKDKAELTGGDISEEMLKVARKKLPQQVLLKKADVHDLPFETGTFDYVITTEAFHHYADQKKALSEMKRVTKKGGKVLVIDINFFLAPLHRLFEKLEPGCIKINSRKEMRELFEQSGLGNIKQQRSFIFAVMTSGEVL